MENNALAYAKRVFTQSVAVPTSVPVGGITLTNKLNIIPALKADSLYWISCIISITVMATSAPTFSWGCNSTLFKTNGGVRLNQAQVVITGSGTSYGTTTGIIQPFLTDSDAAYQLLVCLSNNGSAGSVWICSKMVCTIWELPT